MCCNTFKGVLKRLRTVLDQGVSTLDLGVEVCPKRTDELSLCSDFLTLSASEQFSFSTGEVGLSKLPDSCLHVFRGVLKGVTNLGRVEAARLGVW